MTPEFILKALCWYDPRNPNFNSPEYAEDAREPRKDCACDSCFYGRDRLALAWIELANRSTR